MRGRRRKSACACGRSTDAHNIHYRYRLPEPVLQTEEQEHAPGAWMNDDDPGRATLMQVDDVSPFVRALLPVRLTGGHTVTYGVWVAISPDDLQHAFRVWWEPEYAELGLDGFLANVVAPWDLLRAPVRLEVREPDQTPYVVAGLDPRVASVLDQEWDHDLVLSTLE